VQARNHGLQFFLKNYALAFSPKVSLLLDGEKCCTTIIWSVFLHLYRSERFCVFPLSVYLMYVAVIL